MNAAKKSPLSQDLANILSRVNMEHEPPYKKFRSRSEETFYSINALDLDDYGEELPEFDSSLFKKGNDRTTNVSSQNGLSSHNSGKRNATNTAFPVAERVGQNQYTENKLDSVLTAFDGSSRSSNTKHAGNNWTDKTASDKANEKQNLSSSSDKMKEGLLNCGNKGEPITDCSLQEINLQDQTNQSAYKVRDIKEELGLNRTNGADIKAEKENIDYTVGNVLHDFCRRQENNNELVQSAPHQRVYNLDDYDVDEFYMDDNVDVLCTSAYPISCDKVQDLSTKQNLQSISDILNRTLETIPEEDGEELTGTLQSESGESGDTDQSTKVEPRSECASLTTPRGEPSGNDLKVETCKSNEPEEYKWGQWDDQLNSGYAVSEDLSDVASVTNEITTTMDMSPTNHSKLSESKVASLQSISETYKTGKSDTEPVKSMSGPVEGKPFSNKEIPWYEEDGQNAGDMSVSEESYHSVTSTPSKLPKQDLLHHPLTPKPALVQSSEANTGNNDSTETLKEDTKSSASTISDSTNPIKVSEAPLSGAAKVFDWETADLNSEIAESVVLSDFVSDTECESRHGSSVSNHPKAAIEAISNLVKGKSEDVPVKDVQVKTLPASDGIEVASSSTIHSITSAPGHIETVPFQLSQVPPSKPLILPSGEQKDTEMNNLTTEHGISEISPSSVKYDCFNPGFSSSQLSIGRREGSANPSLLSGMPNKDMHLSDKAVDEIPRIYLSNGFGDSRDGFVSATKGPTVNEASGMDISHRGKLKHKEDLAQIDTVKDEAEDRKSVITTKVPYSTPTPTDRVEATQAGSEEDFNNHTPRAEDFMQEWKQKVNEIFDPDTNKAASLKHTIDKWPPAKCMGNSMEYKIYSHIDDHTQSEKSACKVSNSQVKATPTVSTNGAIKTDIQAFSNYSHPVENTLGTMDLAHSKTNSFYSKYTSTSVKPNGIESEPTTKVSSPRSETTFMGNLSYEVPGRHEGSFAESDQLNGSQYAPERTHLREHSLALHAMANCKERDLQLNSSNSIPADFTFTVEKTESEVIKIQHTKAFISTLGDNQETPATHIKGNKFLSSHRTMDDVSAIGNSSSLYGMNDKGKSRQHNIEINEEHTDESTENKRPSVTPSYDQEVIFTEGLTSANQYTPNVKEGFFHGETSISGYRPREEFHKSVILTESTHRESDQKPIDVVDSGGRRDTLPFNTDFASMGNTNTGTKAAYPTGNFIPHQQENTALGKAPNFPPNAECNDQQYSYDGFHGVRKSYLQGHNKNVVVNGDISKEHTVVYDTFRSEQAQKLVGFTQSEIGIVQHVGNESLMNHNIDFSKTNPQGTKDGPLFASNDSPSPSVPLRQPTQQSSAPDVAKNIILHGSLDDEKQEQLKSSHNYENVYVTPYIPKPKTCTAMATSTALARKDFRVIGKSDMGNLSGDSVVSAVASAEATGESPYVAVARATARAATIATASAAKGVSQGENVGYNDKRDVTIMISTSCTLKDDEESDIKKSSEDVIEALRGDANVAVYTRVAPNPSAVLSKDQYEHQPNTKRKLKVSIEQPFTENSGKHSSECTTVEISLPRDIGKSELSHMISDSVNKMLVSHNKSEQVQSSKTTGNSNDSENEALAINSKGLGLQGIDSNMQNANVVGNEKGNATDVGIHNHVDSGRSIRDRDERRVSATEYSAEHPAYNRHDNNAVAATAIGTGKNIDSHKKPNTSGNTKPVLKEINNNESVTHGCENHVENLRKTCNDLKQVLKPDNESFTTDRLEESSVYSTESSTMSQKQGYKPYDSATIMDTATSRQNARYNTYTLNSQENQSQLLPHVLPESRVKINEARQRFLEDYNGRRITDQAPDAKASNSNKDDGKRKKKKKKKQGKKKDTQNGLSSTVIDNEKINGLSSAERTAQRKSSKHTDYPDMRGLATDSWTDNKKTTTDYHTSSATNPRSSTNQSNAFYEKNGDTEHMSDNMTRANSVGTLPKEFFIKGGSRSSLIETDLDTGVCTEKPLVYETDLDQLHHANRSSSVSNINSGRCQTEPVQNQKATETFERTQSMTVLSDKKKDVISSVHISRVQSYTDNKEPIQSEHINRIHKSLNKLHIPEWYSGSGLKSHQSVQLENTRRDTSRERSPYRVISPQGRGNDGGVSAMIVSTKPVVIQHRVSPVVIGDPNKPQMMAGTLHQATGVQGKESSYFQLPSAKWKRESHSFKPIPIKGLHEVGIKANFSQVSTPAKDAYLKLKNNQEAQHSHRTGSKMGNGDNVPANKSPQELEVNIAAISNDKRMETTHTYVNIHGDLPDPDEKPPPLPPRRPRSTGGEQTRASYSPINYSTNQSIANRNGLDESKGTSPQMKKDTRSESSSSPDALFDSAYASMYKGYTGDTDSKSDNKQEDMDQINIKTSRNTLDVVITDYSKNRVNALVNKFNANWNSHTSLPVHNGIVERPTTETEVFDESYKHGQYNKSGGSANIYKPDTPVKRENDVGKEINSWINDNNIQSPTQTLNSAPQLTDARGQYAHSVSSKASANGQRLEDDVSKRSRSMDDKIAKGMPQTLPRPVYIPPDPLLEKAKASQTRVVSDFAGDVDKNFPLVQYPNSPGMRKGFSPDTTLDTSHDLLEKDSSVDISKGNTTFDDMLDGLLGIPSLNNSLMDTSRMSVKRDTSLSSPTFESPLERALGVMSAHSSTKAGQGASDFDSSVQTSSAQTLDSSADTLDAPTSPLDNSCIVKCRNPKCKKQQEISEAKKSYKTCHNCYTYYCSRECRKAHWEKHKKKCVFSRVNSHCKHVIKKVHAEHDLNEEFSKIARTGYIQKGRGSVLVIFRSLDKAADFLKGSFESLDMPLSFISAKEIEESRLFGEHAFELLDLCRTYNPEVKYIIEVVIIAEESIAQPPTETRRNGPVIKKCAKLRLTNNQPMKQNSGKVQKVEKSIKVAKPGFKVKEDNDTLILTAVPGAEITENMEESRAREICFTNIQMKLKQRGISLRHQYPEVYKKLCMYVSDNQEFSPITLFPTDSKTGRKFMCLIMPNSEPDTEWKSRPDLLQELGFHTEV